MAVANSDNCVNGRTLEVQDELEDAVGNTKAAEEEDEAGIVATTPVTSCPNDPICCSEDVDEESVVDEDCPPVFEVSSSLNTGQCTITFAPTDGK